MVDGTPDAVKVACPVWSGGKSGDYFKGLPITIVRNRAAASPYVVPAARGSARRTKLLYGDGDDSRRRSPRGR